MSGREEEGGDRGVVGGRLSSAARKAGEVDISLAV